jgi:hypothetical protein
MDDRRAGLSMLARTEGFLPSKKLIVLGGQITWTFAAMTREEKGNFRQTLM